MNSISWLKPTLLFFSLIFSLQTTASTLSEPSIKYATLENGFRISANNISINEVVDAQWNGISVADYLQEQLVTNQAVLQTHDDGFHIDVPLTEDHAYIFLDEPVFSLHLTSGEVVASPISFVVEEDDQRRWISVLFRVLRLAWTGYRWSTVITDSSSSNNSSSNSNTSSSGRDVYGIEKIEGCDSILEREECNYRVLLKYTNGETGYADDDNIRIKWSEDSRHTYLRGSTLHVRSLSQNNYVMISATYERGRVTFTKAKNVKLINKR